MRSREADCQADHRGFFCVASPQQLSNIKTSVAGDILDPSNEIGAILKMQMKIRSD
jgi:hypothetical protein